MEFLIFFILSLTHTHTLSFIPSMEFLIFFILFSFLHTEASNTNTPSINCNNGDPNIRLPFRLQTYPPSHSILPTINLNCKHNKTMIHFQTHDLLVKSISYDIKKLNLLDPKNCVHEVFLNLNLSLTPFKYYYVTKNYTYLNCSARLSPSIEEVPCLSGYGLHVYVVEPSFDMPEFCVPVKTVAIPFSYSSYISDDSFGLGLTWDEAGFRSGKAKGGSGMTNGKVFGIISLCIFVVVTMIIGKTYYSKKTKNVQIESYDQVANLLPDCETTRNEGDLI